MSWIFERHAFESQLNGIIKCSRFFGAWTVLVENQPQSGEFTRMMWKKAMRKIPKDFKGKNILVLGMGGGSVIPQLHKRFQNPHVSVIEWDPVMVQIAKELTLPAKIPKPEIILGDAVAVAASLERKFDLIIVDLFQGNVAGPHFFNSSFITNLRKILHDEGAVLLNCWLQPDLLNAYDLHFSRHKTWRMIPNTFGFYKKFGKGNVGDPLPEGYSIHNSNLAYQQREADSHILGQHLTAVHNTAVGGRWHNGLFTVEKYIGDIEPTPQLYSRNRIVLWQPLTQTGKKAGWRRSPIHNGKLQIGVAHLTSSEYANEWSEHARRQLKKWRNQAQYRIVPGTLEAMCQGILSKKNTSFDWILKNIYVKVLQGKVRGHRDFLSFYLVEDVKTKAVVAGLAVFDVPETKTSVHFFAFHFPEAFHSGAGVGLIDRWYADSFKKGIEWMDFDLVYTKGDPRSWKGFSRFKMQFNLHLIKFPKGYFRIMRGTK